MQFSTQFIRALFFLLSILFFSTFGITHFNFPSFLINASLGALSGVLFAGVLFSIENRARHLNLRTLNLTALGLFFGYLLAQACIGIFQLALENGAISLSDSLQQGIRIGIILFCSYLGIILTLKGSQELALSIPFIKFNPTQEKKKDILLDAHALSDSRLVDLANSGLLDQQLVIPNYAIKELESHAESGEDQQRYKARKGLEALKKMQSLPALHLRIIENDAPELQDHYSKLTRIARQIDANLLTADISKIQQSEMEGLKVININFLSQVLKPVTSAGEHLQIKILRYGKEPRQGVGYLDDGTMVVINGGAEFMGQTIKALVLSVKSTPAGRMIFCNAAEGSEIDGHLGSHVHARDLESSTASMH